MKKFMFVLHLVTTRRQASTPFQKMTTTFALSTTKRGTLNFTIGVTDDYETVKDKTKCTFLETLKIKSTSNNILKNKEKSQAWCLI